MSGKYSDIIFVPGGFRPEEPRAREILGPPRAKTNLVCTRCHRLFKTEFTTLACPRCMDQMKLEAAAAEGVSNGNLPRNTSRVVGHMKPRTGTGVRPKLRGEDDL